MIDMTRRTFLGAAVLIAAMPALAAAERKGVRIRLQAFLDRTGEARGRFAQTVTDKTGREAAQPSEGIFRFRRPGRFEWTYEKPYRQQIMSDGETLWIYDPDLMQVTVRRLDGAVGSTPAGILFGSNDLVNWYYVGSSVNMYLRNLVGSPYKYFRLALMGSLDPKESISALSIDFQPRLQNKLR